MNDGVDLSNVLQEFVSQTSALTRTLDEPSDVPDLYLSRSYFCRLGRLYECFDLLIVDCYFRHVRVDCAEGIVAGLCLLGLGQCIEECGFPNIWVAHDTARCRTGPAW